MPDSEHIDCFQNEVYMELHSPGITKTFAPGYPADDRQQVDNTLQNTALDDSNQTVQ